MVGELVRQCMVLRSWKMAELPSSVVHWLQTLMKDVS
jgi:hypothetical protein